MAKAKKRSFSVVLKQEEVFIIGEDNVEVKYFVRELTSEQKELHDKAFDVKITIGDDDTARATPGDNFEIISSHKFLSWCLYTEEGANVDIKAIRKYPSLVTKALHEIGLELSGMDKESKAKAKNELKQEDTSGTD